MCSLAGAKHTTIIGDALTDQTTVLGDAGIEETVVAHTEYDVVREASWYGGVRRTLAKETYRQACEGDVWGR